MKNMIGGKQFTITWNMVNLKLSRVDKKLLDKIIKWMKGLYVQDMRISRVKNHDYLGMILYLSVMGQVAVTIVDELKRVISDF